jgi:hypothetical protein
MTRVIQFSTYEWEMERNCFLSDINREGLGRVDGFITTDQLYDVLSGAAAGRERLYVLLPNDYQATNCTGAG